MCPFCLVSCWRVAERSDAFVKEALATLLQAMLADIPFAVAAVQAALQFTRHLVEYIKK